MRLIHLTSSGGWGGREMYPAVLAQAQKKRGHQVCLVAKVNTPLAGYLAGSDLEHTLLRVGPYFDPLAARNLARILREKRPEVIHVHLSRDLALVRLACGLARQHPAVILHKHIASAGNKRDPLHRYLYGTLAAVIAVSDFVKESLVASCPIDRSRIEVLFCGLDTGSFKPFSPAEERERAALRAELGAGEPDQVLAAVAGRMEARKGQEVFLRAASIAAHTQPGMRFALIGSAEGGYDSHLKDLADRLEIADRVAFTGHRRDIHRLMAALDILAVPSLAEAFGLVAAEGMLLARAVVAARAGALPEFIEHGSTGLLVPPMDQHALAEALERLALDRELRDSLGQKGRAWALENLSLDHILDRIDQIYEKCLSRTHNHP